MTKEYLERQFQNYHDVVGAYVTPEMFGAKGDGVTDDYASFMDAYNESVSTGKTLKLTKKYLLGTKVSLSNSSNKPITIEGTAVQGNNVVSAMGANSNIVAPNGFEIWSYIRLKNVGFYNYGITVYGIRNEIDGCVFEGCTTAIDMVGGFNEHRAAWYGEVFIDNCSFSNCTTGIEFEQDSVTSRFYADCRISNCLCMQGTTFVHGRFSALTFTENHVYSTKSIDAILTNSIIENNYFDTNDVALNLGIMGGTSTISSTVSVNNNMFYKDSTTLDANDKANPVVIFYGNNTTNAMFNNNFCSKALDETHPEEVFVKVNQSTAIQYADNTCKIKFIELGANANKISADSSSNARYNVLDYGLKKGQISTIDNSVALEAMIAEIPEGSVIYFPQGIYRFATPMTITKRFAFVGDNDFDHVNTTAGASHPQSEILFNGAENTTFLTIDGVDVSFEGLSFFCQNGSTPGYSIQLNTAEFTGFPYPCFTSSVDRANINCICVKDDAAIKRLAVSNCTFKGFSGYALQITDFTFVRFCNFNGCGIGVQVSGTDDWIQNCIFVGCGICVKNVENSRWSFMNLAMSDTWADQIVEHVFTSALPSASQIRLFFDNLWIDMVNKAAIYLPTQYLVNSRISGRFSRCGMSYAEDEAQSRIPTRDATSQDAMDAIVLNRVFSSEFDIQINRREIGKGGNANGVCCAYAISSLGNSINNNRIRVYDTEVERAVYSPNIWGNTTIEGRDKSVLTDSIWMYDYPPVVFRNLTPVNKVTPRRAGMLACDYSAAGGLYRSTGTTNADWEIVAAKPSNGKELVAKWNTFPTANADRLGWTIMYMGATDLSTQKIHGATYECISDGAATPTYSWVAISVPMEGWKAIVSQCNDFTDFKNMIAQF